MDADFLGYDSRRSLTRTKIVANSPNNLQLKQNNGGCGHLGV